MSRSLNRLPYSQSRGKRFDQFSQEEDRENYGSHTQDHRGPIEFSGIKNRTPFHSTNMMQELNESK
jgi:hypothetical protein